MLSLVLILNNLAQFSVHDPSFVIDKFGLVYPSRHLLVHSQQWKRQKSICEIYLKLTIKTPERRH